ncbi:hypothetical protein PHMEG_00032706 [Phytophthora megakarya]|uniref:No apical meristem-associated C-terminal domain-containing protein n=1 Tax=Phytophthora megakarya TaxID=4795 RepID=A0A225UUC3_9STRA|nr:hypothetical protein PHMEG_00032706 [Phytophthora megakarya]
MGKGSGWSEAETVQLCRSWLETSEDPVVGAGQKKKSFINRLGRWKKLQPEVTKFCGVYANVKSKERELKDKPKWTIKITSDTTARAKRKAGGDGDVPRPGGCKAAKAEQQKPRDNQSTRDEAHLRFIEATEKKAEIVQQQLYYTIFMQDQQSAESKEYFLIQRKAIFAQLKEKQTAEATAVIELTTSNPDVFSYNREQDPVNVAIPNGDKENKAMAYNISVNNCDAAFPSALL